MTHLDLQYREELRTAKITALVLVIAFVCWSPFFLLLLCVAFQPQVEAPFPGNFTSGESGFREKAGTSNTTTTLDTFFWLHYTSCLMALGFGAASPYVYVFRSDKVQKCLKQLLFDLLCCCYSEAGNELTSKLASRAGSISCVQVRKIKNMLHND